jgi:hypothetical protein
MPSGIVILAAYNAEDQFLVGNPQISHFRSAYIHHRPFSTEYRKVSFDTRTALGQNTMSVEFPRDGDLIKSVYLQANFPSPPSGYSWTNSLGYACIKEARLRTGETMLDRQTGEWMNTWGTLTTPVSKQAGFNDMIGKDETTNKLTGPQDLLIPLPFWFCRHSETAFPLISLQKQTLRLEIDTRPLEDLVVNSPECGTRISLSDAVSFSLIVEYVYLDREEARWFTNRPQVYLIEQVQQDLNNENCGGSDIIRKELPFNGLMKELIFLTRYRVRSRENLWFFYSNQEPGVAGGGEFMSGEHTLAEGVRHGDIIKSAKIQYDSYDIVDNYPARFYRVLQPYQHHTVTPDDYIYCYSWAINPEQWNPSGHINTFRSSNMTLVLRKSDEAIEYPTILHSYALMYNIMKINGGVCGLEFQYN